MQPEWIGARWREWDDFQQFSGTGHSDLAVVRRFPAPWKAPPSHEGWHQSFSSSRLALILAWNSLTCPLHWPVKIESCRVKLSSIFSRHGLRKMLIPSIVASLLCLFLILSCYDFRWTCDGPSFSQKTELKSCRIQIRHSTVPRFWKCQCVPKIFGLHTFEVFICMALDERFVIGSAICIFKSSVIKSVATWPILWPPAAIVMKMRVTWIARPCHFDDRYQPEWIQQMAGVPLIMEMHVASKISSEN